MTNEQMSNPYVGPRTFTETQRHLFFGREREASELLARVLSERLVLFYAQSGAGKSSLINTRLIPHLREIGHAVLPIARVSGDLPNSVQTVDNIYLFNLMLSLDSSGHQPNRFAHMQLPQFLARLSSDDGLRYVYEETFETEHAVTSVPSTMPYVLIIDQFEELITHHPGQWQKREEFFRQLNQAMIDDPKLWVVLSFREDFLAPIEQYAPLMQDRMRAQFYMERMSNEAAIEAVRKPAEYGGRPFAPKVAEQLVKDLRQIRVSGQKNTVAGQYVEPVQLQIVCYQLWQNLEDRPLGPITSENLHDVGDIDQALIKFYEDVLASVLVSFAPVVSERRLRTWFEKELITPDRTRGLVRQSRETTGDLPNKVVSEFQKRFIVRTDTRSGDTRIEIVHDRFVEPILASNRDWRAKNENPLVAAAEAWLDENKNARRLLSGEQLRSAAAQLEASKNELSVEEYEKITALLNASENQELQRTELLMAQRMAFLEPQKYISEMGWGIIFPAVSTTDPAYEEKQKEINAIKEALLPLLEHRKAEATLRRKEFYREFIGSEGYRSGETAHDFLSRHGVGPGKVDPNLMPYYLLLVGDPRTMPFEFQYQLDVQYAVGRVHFDTHADYRRYAESIVKAETEAATLPKRVALFATSGDRALTLLRNDLIQPLLEYLEAQRPDWPVISMFDDYATKSRLGQILGGNETPALVVIASHGAGFIKPNPDQLDYQGALSGFPLDWRFSADDIPETANLTGLIAFVFASYGAGTPEFDNFPTRLDREPMKIAEHPFLAKLPQRLLSHPQGGALAFIGHVERAWQYSFKWNQSSQTGVRTYASLVERLLDGYPVGAAVEFFNRRYAELATVLSAALLNRATEKELIRLQAATNDARNWIVIGDPAVRLMVSNLRPDMTGLQLFYKVENLRSEGDQLAEAGNLAGAEAKYQEVLELNPWLGFDPATEACTVAARTSLRKAYELAKEGKIGEATALFEEAKHLNPDIGLEALKEVRRISATFFLGQGRVAAGSGDYGRAIALLEQASVLDPNLEISLSKEAGSGMAQYHTREGRRLASEGDVDSAIIHFQLARKFDPTLNLEPKTEAGRFAANFFVEEGTNLAGQGELEQAVEAFRKAANLDPSLNFDPGTKAAQLIAQYQKQQVRDRLQQPQDEKVTSELEQMLWFNGINAVTGEYSIFPMVVEELARQIRGEVSPSDLQKIRPLQTHIITL